MISSAPFVPLITQRLILRAWTLNDLDAYTAINQDPRVLEFLPGPLTREQAAEQIKRFNAEINECKFGLLACELKATGELIGFVGLSIPQFEAPFTPCIELGYRLGSQYWGNGYATEAARAVLQFAFRKLNLKEIVAFTVPANTRSRNVMEKLGMLRNPADDFQHPKLADGHPLREHVLYRLTRDQYFKGLLQPLRIDDDLVLVPVQLDKSQEQFELIDKNRAHLRTWLDWVDLCTDVNNTLEYNKLRVTAMQEGMGYDFCIRYQNKMVGFIGLHHIEVGIKASTIGYWLDADMQGKGIMTRACRALCDWAFTNIGLNRLEIHCAMGNLKSQHIPERLGFVREGVFRDVQWLYDHYVDHAIYGMLAREWFVLKSKKN